MGIEYKLKYQNEEKFTKNSILKILKMLKNLKESKEKKANKNMKHNKNYVKLKQENWLLIQEVTKNWHNRYWNPRW